MARTKPVWQTSREGILVGMTVADESPLEPGVWLVPLGAVEVEPPHNLPEGHAWRWDGERWTALRLPQPPSRLRLALASILRRLLMVCDQA